MFTPHASSTDPTVQGAGLRIGIVQARFNTDITNALAQACRTELQRLGVSDDHIEHVMVPGALEVPAAIASASNYYDGFVALGVVIRGETYHFEIVAGESARGIMAMTMDGMAIGNGILTVENEAQALVRADPKQKDKGGEAAKAALALLALKDKFGA